MNCSEARTYLFPFLDNELDSALSIEVQRHIEHCPHCARECEIEHTVRKQLTDRLLQVNDIPPYEESFLTSCLAVERAIETPSMQTRRPSRRFVLSGAIVASILLAGTWFVANRATSPKYVPLAHALVDDFDRFVSESKPLEIVSADAEEVSNWLRRQTSLPINIPVVEPDKGTLVGGRKCVIDGTLAAFAVYHAGDDWVSIVALRHEDEALAHMTRVERDGHTHWVDKCRGHTVLACRRGKLIYAVVSRLSEASLSRWMPPA